jgi:Protein of unknown function (DUF3592)
VSALPENYPTSNSAPPPRSLYPGTFRRAVGSLVGIGIALWVMCWAVNDYLWPTYRVKYVYVATTAEVLETRIKQTMEKGSRRTGPYVLWRPQVRIRYIADGRPYDSWIDVWWSDSDSNDPAKNAAELARLKPGTSVPAWYDPDQPDRAVVTRDYRSWDAGLIRMILGIWGFVICSCMLCREFTRRGVPGVDWFWHPSRPEDF